MGKERRRGENKGPPWQPASVGLTLSTAYLSGPVSRTLHLFPPPSPSTFPRCTRGKKARKNPIQPSFHKHSDGKCGVRKNFSPPRTLEKQFPPPSSSSPPPLACFRFAQWVKEEERETVHLPTRDARPSVEGRKIGDGREEERKGTRKKGHLQFRNSFFLPHSFTQSTQLRKKLVFAFHNFAKPWWFPFLPLSACCLLRGSKLWRWDGMAGKGKRRERGRWKTRKGSFHWSAAFASLQSSDLTLTGMLSDLDGITSKEIPLWHEERL